MVSLAVSRPFAPSPSDAEMLDSLPLALKTAYRNGVASGDIEIYETERVVRVREGEGNEGGVIEYALHLLPTLSLKPSPSSTLPDLSTPPSSLNPPKKDVFAPPFPEPELICSLTDYHVLLNKFCFLPEQFVLITKRWAVQAERAEEEDLWMSREVVRRWEGDGKGLLGFYNCGPRSAASQPHRHIQFVPFQDGGAPPPTEKLALSLDLVPSIPTPLRLPYLHLTTRLPSSLTPKSLHAIYLASLALHPSSSTSHNLLLTSTHLHTIPRSERDVFLTAPEAKTENEGDVTNGKEREKGEERKELRLGPNGLGFAGLFFIKPGDEGLLAGWGVGRALRGVGYAPGEVAERQ